MTEVVVNKRFDVILQSGETTSLWAKCGYTDGHEDANIIREILEESDAVKGYEEIDI